MGWNLKQLSKFPWLTLLAFISLLSITLNFTLLDKTNRCEKKLNEKFPKLEKVENTYRIIKE